MRKKQLVQMFAWTLAWGLIPLLGCAKRADPIHLVIAIDISDRTEERVLRYAAWAHRLQRRLRSDDEVSVIVYAREADLVYQGRPLKDRSRFNEAIGPYLINPRQGLTEPGTDHSAAIDLIGQIADRSKRQLVSFVCTDGAWEIGFDEAERVTLPRVSKLSANTNLVALRFIGVHAERRSQWTELLSSLADRSSIHGFRDAEFALSLEGVRR